MSGVSRSYTEKTDFPMRSREALNYLDRIVGGLVSRFLAWLVRRLPNEQQRMLAFTIVAGGLCGLAAVAFHVTIGWLEALLIDPANARAGTAGSSGRSCRPPLAGWLSVWD